MTDETPRPLPEAIDEAASALAEAIRLRAAEPESDLVELTKAFTIVSNYATDRAKDQAELAPKKGNKVDGLRDRFNGTADTGRRSARSRKGAAANGAAQSGSDSVDAKGIRDPA